MMEDSWQAQEPNLNGKISFKPVENQNYCSDIDEGLNEEKKRFLCTICGGTCLLRLYLPVFAQTKRCEFAPTQKGDFAKKYK